MTAFVFALQRILKPLLLCLFSESNYIVLEKAGDVHPNPGPLSSSSSLSSSSLSNTLNGSISSNLNQFHHLSFIQYNVQSIINKLDLFTVELSEFDILAFSETWLHAGISTNDLLIPSYNYPERKDRDRDPHGGVVIYVKESLNYKRRQDLELPGIECIWLEIILQHKRLLFGLFYRPPNSDQIYHSLIEDSIHLAIDSGITDVIVTGDFNYNLMNDVTNRKILSICQQFSMHQYITEPTHFTENSYSLLDIILVSNTNNVITCGVGDPFLTQDIRYHCPVYGILKFSKPKYKSFERQIWSYDRGDYDLLRDRAALSNWDSFKDADIDTYARNVTNHIKEISKQCIPNKTIRVRPLEPPWITSSIKKQIRKRKRLYRRAKTTNNPDIWNKFRRQRNKTISLIRLSKQNHIDKLKAKLKSENLTSKDWWSTLKYFISSEKVSNIPPLKSNNNIIFDATEKANLLNDFFTAQTVINDQNVGVPDVTDRNVISELSIVVLTADEVKSVLKSLPVGKASGPDGITNRVLKELADQMAMPLSLLFNQSIEDGKIPTDWKEAYVSPVPKGGDLSLSSNYRPIFLLSNLDKIFERAIFKHIYNHLRDNSILTAYQSGFTPGDSTINQLTYMYDTFCSALDSGKEVRAVFCDISKAFDRVWHKGLIRKLKTAGITGTLLKWFKSYLDERKQRVVIPGAKSDWTFIQAGEPQGSILGPLLFLIFINDIVTEIGSNIRLFADDTSLYIIVEHPDTAALCLNNDLQTITDWAHKWLVTFNPLKTESLTISRKINKPYHPPLYMSGTQINEVNNHKHLGIYLSNDCTWHNHIEYIKEKAWKRLNTMRRLKLVLDRKSLEIVYISFIRPILEYGDILWDNCTLYEKRELDKIQNEAARIVTGTTALVSLQSLYDEVGWESLQSRRSNHKLCLFFKMQHDLTPAYLSFLVPPSVSETSRYNLRNADDFTTIPCRSQQYYTSFLPSVVRDWNNLPQHAKQINSLLSFKSFQARNKTKVPKHFYTGKRYWQVMHTRIRTNCSALNSDLYSKNITDSSLCSCGAVENAHHFFFTCPRYHEPRADMLDTLAFLPEVTLNLILYGDESICHENNVGIFSAVQKFIEKTKRF